MYARETDITPLRQSSHSPSDSAAVKVNAFFDSHHFHDLPRIPKSYEVLSELHATGHFEFVIVTSRQHKLMEHTEKWIHRHYPGIFSKLMFGNHYGETGIKRDKSAMCLEVGAKILIDDSLKYAKDASSAGIPVLLFDWEGKYPWSKTEEELHHSVNRVHDWDQVRDKLLEFIQKPSDH
jgi:5'(3')-deoxyribonucleotidase